ncbi:MAG: hypothetical protein JRI55_26825, partial [Deltaproteobacteria bacterium]|nr:hypothetical protein [Deltaproteobacteria bacterium]
LGIEELLYVRDSMGPIHYELDLPAGWRTRRAKSKRAIVELVDAAGVPRMRMVADRAWDATGKRARIAMSVEGSQIELGVAPDAPTTVLLDPEWQEAGQASVERYEATSTLLPNGKVLVAGGVLAEGHESARAAELFDPNTATYEQAADMTVPRSGHTATLLKGSGDVLIAGGQTVASDGQLASSATAELFSPGLDAFSATGSMAEARDGATATRLHDGRVLVVGGVVAYSDTADQVSGDPHTLATSAELYDPTTGEFTRTQGAPRYARMQHQAVLLPDDKVLVVGGGSSSMLHFGLAAKAELYDPGEDHFTATGSLSSGRRAFAAVHLPAVHQVLVAGGVSRPPEYVDGIELYDVDDETFTDAGELPEGQYRAAGSLLPDGRVLLSDGVNAGLWDPTAAAFDVVPAPPLLGPFCPTLLPHGRVLATAVPQALFYDPAEPAIDAPLPDLMAVARWMHTATLLPNGEVLVVGVGPENDPGLVAEIYDPQNASFRIVQGVSPRIGHTATRLPNGKVLLAGGRVGNMSGSTLATAEIFDPATEQTIPVDEEMSESRGWYDATLLPDGRVLVTGGWTGVGYRSSAELFDPVSRTWERVEDLHSPRWNHTSALLPDGRVLVVGGASRWEAGGWDGPVGYVPPEVFDPAENRFSVLDSRDWADHLNARSAVLPDGRVLVVGGAMLDLFDPVSESFSPCSAGTFRWRARAELLPSGNVALVGGWSQLQDLATAAVYLFDPYANGTRPAGEMTVGRANHASALLPDGGVLLVGGHATFQQPLVALRSAEVWRETPLPDPDLQPEVTTSFEQPTHRALAPGDVVVISGSGFTGHSESSGGSLPSATNHPVAMWMPLRGAPSHGRVLEGWTDTELRWQVPATSYAGPGLLFIAVNGVRSVGVSATITQAQVGVPCPGDGACNSGYCTDGVCCEDRCDAPCQACSTARKGSGENGQCGIAAEGAVDPQCDPGPGDVCGTTGMCDANGECALVAEGSQCSVDSACFGGECRASYCDGEHTVKRLGSLEDCSPYRCSTEDHRCVQKCSSNVECIDGFICSPDGQCVEFLGDDEP